MARAHRLSSPVSLPRRYRASRIIFYLACLILLASALLFLTPDADPAEDPHAWLDEYISPPEGEISPGVTKGAQRFLSFWKDEEDPDLPRGLRFGADGLVRGWDGVHEIMETHKLGKKDKRRLKEVRDRHPIEELIARGQERWEGLLANQSKTLPQAVAEYTRRYDRAPPKGFEEWWQFCKRNQVKIVDDYDQINRDIEPFLALSPELFRKRAKDTEATAHSYKISLSPSGEATISGERASSSRGRHLRDLLAPLAELLPTEITITVSDHDLGSWLLGDDQRQAALKAARKGRYLSEASLKGFEQRNGRVAAPGLVSACPEGSSAWNRSLGLQDNMADSNGTKETTFVYDPRPTFDFCTNPSLLQQHGSLSFDFARETMLRPIFQLSKFVRNPEFLTTPLEAYENATSKSAMEKYTPWEGKTENKLFWRGSSTGDSYSKRKNYDWRNSHRQRLHLMAQATEGDQKVWVERGKDWELEAWNQGKLNEKYLDVGLAGKPHQCKQEDGTCDEMANEIHFKDRVRPEDSATFKYVLDVDGNGWSSRYHRLMLSGSAVVKTTIYPEWHSDWLTPWVHYIPSQVDYSDIYSIMSFFIGPPDGRAGGHEDLARGIAEAGRQFALEHWRWEDMQAYMFRLLLEYSRLMADDRKAASYQKTYETKA
ncbi:hypothetical protein JCM24511_03167 [Saitozyma sp. JCM 24511]|nr:hypothetical protein JCM24511_03167 [Saitozyma sp. JCM 24511]